MAFSYVDYSVSSTTAGPFSFAAIDGYLSVEHIYVYKNGTLVNPSQYTLSTDPPQITLNVSAIAGDKIRIRRITPNTEDGVIVPFQDGSILRSRDLRISQLQSLFVAQEFSDTGVLIPGGSSGPSIPNVGDLIVWDGTKFVFSPPGTLGLQNGTYGDIVVSGTGNIWKIRDGVYGDVSVSSNGSVWSLTGALAPDGDYGDIVVSNDGNTWELDDAVRVLPPDGDYGDITVSSSGSVWSVDGGSGLPPDATYGQIRVDTVGEEPVPYWSITPGTYGNIISTSSNPASSPGPTNLPRLDINPGVYGDITIFADEVGANRSYWSITDATYGQIVVSEEGLEWDVKIGSTSGLPIKTGTDGVIEAGAFGSSAGQFAEGNHTHGSITNDGKVGSTAGLVLKTGAAGVVETLALGSAGQVLKVNSGATGIEWGTDNTSGGGGGGNVSSDTIWDVKGDLAVGTGDDTAAKLTAGTNGYYLVTDSAESTGLKWQALELGDLSVSTGKIQGDAVTYAKMQNVSATDKILGRSSSGAGDVEEITCTSFARQILDDTTGTAVRGTIDAASDSHDHIVYDAYIGMIESPTVGKTYTIDMYSQTLRTIDQVYLKCGSGTIDFTLKRNVSGAVATIDTSDGVGTTLYFNNSTLTNTTIAAGTSLLLTIDASASGADLEFSFRYDRKAGAVTES